MINLPNSHKSMVVTPTGGSMSYHYPTSKRNDVEYENERVLLKIIQSQFNITDDDMKSPTSVISKIRESNINRILELTME